MKRRKKEVTEEGKRDNKEGYLPVKL